MKKKLIIFGTGELASIALDSFNLQDKFEIECFTADKKFIKKNIFRNLPVVPFEDIEKNCNPSEYQMHVALSYKELNKIREKKYLEAKNKGYSLASFISKDTHISKNTIFGENCFILENQTIVKSGTLCRAKSELCTSNYSVSSTIPSPKLMF